MVPFGGRPFKTALGAKDKRVTLLLALGVDKTGSTEVAGDNVEVVNVLFSTFFSSGSVSKLNGCALIVVTAFSSLLLLGVLFVACFLDCPFCISFIKG